MKHDDIIDRIKTQLTNIRCTHKQRKEIETALLSLDSLRWILSNEEPEPELSPLSSFTMDEIIREIQLRGRVGPAS